MPAVKVVISLMLLLSLPLVIRAASPAAQLDPALHDLFSQMQIEEGRASLTNRVVKTDLTVKVANQRFLIFSDAYLQKDDGTKYQIGKWSFAAQQITPLRAQRGDPVKVTFRIDEVRTEAPYASMPHFTATILSITRASR